MESVTNMGDACAGSRSRVSGVAYHAEKDQATANTLHMAWFFINGIVKKDIIGAGTSALY